MTTPIGPKNLIPGQYQIGNMVFGRGTTVPVETFDIKPYDVNPQDHQVSLSDEMRFGIDSYKPTTIEITFHVLSNRLLPGFEDTIPNFWRDMPNVADFQREWRFDEGRKIWGSIKPLYACGKDRITRMIYGRPRQFTYAKDSERAESVQCLGEFQRSDTLAYTAQEQYIELAGGAVPWYFNSAGGDSPTWFRILAYGPMTKPKFLVGNHNVDLDTTIKEGEVLEVSSYPWLRRAVDSNRVNLAANMIGKSQYLDRMQIPWNETIPVRWTSDELNTWFPDLGNKTWEEDIQSEKMFNLPTYYEQITGRTVVRFDLFNFTNGAPFLTPSKFIGSGAFSSINVIIDREHKFNSEYQYSEARVTEPFGGRSGIAIMCNGDMTNYAVLDVQTGIFNEDKLVIRHGTSPTTWSASKAQFSLGPTGSFKETDRVGIGYEPTTKTYSAYLNGNIVANWADSGNLIDINNRHQAYLFDMDANLLTPGTGFRDLLFYDRKGGVPQPIPPGAYPIGPPPAGSLVGRAFMLWHDAWSTIV